MRDAGCVMRNVGVTGADGVAGVFNQGEIVLAADFLDFCHAAAVAAIVHHDDGLRPKSGRRRGDGR